MADAVDRPEQFPVPCGVIGIDSSVVRRDRPNGRPDRRRVSFIFAASHKTMDGNLHSQQNTLVAIGLIPQSGVRIPANAALGANQS
jgi:hypothetical protein